ncbi:MAG: type II toxin-antitoxin system Phd/YefM family antitoxin [Oceanococcaceae bacterium]
MKIIAAREAKNQFGQFLDAAQRAPVRVTKKGRSVAVMMSEEQFQRLRGAAWSRLQATVDQLRADAAAAGLTEAELATLLTNDD